MTLISLLPAFMPIPARPFLMATPERELSALARAYGGTRESYREESPQHQIRLQACFLAVTPVTNALYALFVAASGATPPVYWHGVQPPAALADHPVADVNWHDARAFCAWLSAELAAQQYIPAGLAQPPQLRLPSEAEWEHAARGSDGRRFPWGEVWDTARANTRDGGPGRTTPVGRYPAGSSPYGCLDMAGNVWEWTASLDAPYPYVADDGREDSDRPGRRILRGGCYANPHGFARCACRFRLAPDLRNPFLGFRLACS
ncbi:MAG TPA: formylglycine-generating enzyme family protein [Roseiflexaceae bacterium]|nr:formylglycine-generating enzyme family protein [Roseiflexaceae bacterium]